MKTLELLFILVVCFARSGLSQGSFLFDNSSAPTRLGTIDGPLAGPGIWARMLAGTTQGSLIPVGSPRQHFGEGRVSDGIVIVEGIGCFETAYVQMVAWDGQAWGSSLADVPLDQLGRTDIVPRILSCDPLPVLAPDFTQPAVVPPIPEPSISTLGLLGGLVAFGLRRGVGGRERGTLANRRKAQVHRTR
jgi:hypothetical protein